MTTEPVDEARLQCELDGENTTEESAALLRRLESDAPLRERYQNLVWLKEALGRIGSPDPPPGLSSEVMRAVRRSASAEARKQSWWEALRAPFVRRPAFGYALATAAGIVVGVFLVGPLGPLGRHGRISPDSSAAGTILPEGRLGSHSREARQDLIAEGLRGEVVVTEHEGKVLAGISLESDRPLDISLGFDPEAFSPAGFERRGTVAGTLGLAPGEVLIKGAGGSGLCLVTLIRLKPTPWALQLDLTGQGIHLQTVLEERPGG